LLGRLTGLGKDVSGLFGAAVELPGNVLKAVLTSRPVIDTLDLVVAKIEDRVVDRVLPVILAKLQDEEEQVRQIVQGQSSGMVVDLVNSVRDRAADADRMAEKAVRRLMPWSHSPQPGSTGDTPGVAVEDGVSPPTQ
jgi:hypothetical protein